MPFTSGVLSVTSIKQNRVALSVSTPTGGVPPYHNQFVRADDINGSPGTYVPTGGDTQSWGDLNLEPGTFYWWQALGTDSDTPPSHVTSNAVRAQTLGLADLITQPQLLSLLTTISPAALTAGQQAQLPFLATSISRFIRKWCNRQFTRAVRDEQYTADPGDNLLLKEFPVNTILQCRTKPEAVITIGNSDTATNQYAFVELLTTGNADVGLTATGVNLLRTASGVAIAPVFVDFTTNITINALAAAVNAAGNGWQATVLGSFGLWPTADIVPIQDGLPALGIDQASLLIHTQFIRPICDKDTGIISWRPGEFDPINSTKFGPTQFTEFGDQQVSGQTLGVRIKYDAGYDVIPEDLQLACAWGVWSALMLLRVNPLLKAEEDGTYKWEGRELYRMLPEHVQQILDMYASHRA